jgi:hypothetical protein
MLLAMATTSLSAQPPAPPKTTHVLATLSLKPGITREQIQPTMPAEVRETVALYLDGKIEQWYSRGDGKGVVFLLNCSTVAEAKAILETLPLVKHNFAAFDYMPLGPLNPLRVLMDAPAK